jgi:hypothetical protein
MEHGDRISQSAFHDVLSLAVVRNRHLTFFVGRSVTRKAKAFATARLAQRRVAA